MSLLLPKYNTAWKIASSVSYNWMRQVHGFHILMSNWDVRQSHQSSGMIASESLIENHSHSQNRCEEGEQRLASGCTGGISNSGDIFLYTCAFTVMKSQAC